MSASSCRAARAAGCEPNKFSDWWYRSRRKLRALFLAMPGETAAELMAICVEGAEEQADESSSPRK